MRPYSMKEFTDRMGDNTVIVLPHVHYHIPATILRWRGQYWILNPEDIAGPEMKQRLVAPMKTRLGRLPNGADAGIAWASERTMQDHDHHGDIRRRMWDAPVEWNRVGGSAYCFSRAPLIFSPEWEKELARIFDEITEPEFFASYIRSVVRDFDALPHRIIIHPARMYDEWNDEYLDRRIDSRTNDGEDADIERLKDARAIMRRFWTRETNLTQIQRPRVRHVFTGWNDPASAPGTRVIEMRYSQTNGMTFRNPLPKAELFRELHRTLPKRWEYFHSNPGGEGSFFVLEVQPVFSTGFIESDEPVIINPDSPEPSAWDIGKPSEKLTGVRPFHMPKKKPGEYEYKRLYTRGHKLPRVTGTLPDPGWQAGTWESEDVFPILISKITGPNENDFEIVGTRLISSGTPRSTRPFNDRYQHIVAALRGGMGDKRIAVRNGDEVQDAIIAAYEVLAGYDPKVVGKVSGKGASLKTFVIRTALNAQSNTLRTLCEDALNRTTEQLPEDRTEDKVHVTPQLNVIDDLGQAGDGVTYDVPDDDTDEIINLDPDVNEPTSSRTLYDDDRDVEHDWQVSARRGGKMKRVDLPETMHGLDQAWKHWAGRRKAARKLRPKAFATMYRVRMHSGCSSWWRDDVLYKTEAGAQAVADVVTGSGPMLTYATAEPARLWNDVNDPGGRRQDIPERLSFGTTGGIRFGGVAAYDPIGEVVNSCRVLEARRRHG